jgi:hypothetical protein
MMAICGFTLSLETMDKRFCLQAILSLIVVGFCLDQIKNGNTEGVYWSTVSGILGYWLPSPIEKNNEQRTK